MLVLPEHKIMAEASKKISSNILIRWNMLYKYASISKWYIRAKSSR